MNVAVVGTGYVGLVTGVCLAELGHDVICVDSDARRVAKIERGEVPFFERGVEGLLSRHLGRRLRASTDVRSAVLASELTLIAVGTPLADGRIDLGAVRAVTSDIGKALRDHDTFHAVVVKSTVVPGTTQHVVLPLIEEVSGITAGERFGVGMNPEFLTEGEAVDDFMAPDRIVLGAADDRTYEVLERLYDPLPSDIPRLRTSPTTAELIKYASNALLATMISFANEVGNLSAALEDADVVDVMRGVHLSRYLSPAGEDGEPVRAPISSFLEAGCGFGGSCLPKDVRALIAHGQGLGVHLPLLGAVMQVNAERPDRVIDVITQALPVLAGARVAVLGLAFQPDTDAVRESPAIPIVERLSHAGAHVRVHDPVVEALPQAVAQLDNVVLTSSLEDSVNGADAVVLVTRWEHYRRVPDLIAKLEPTPIFVDGRRMFERREFDRYAGIGA